MECCCRSECFSRLKRKIKRVNISRRLVKAYIALFVAIFSSSYAITMLFPFAPFMVRFLLPNVEETNVGNYVGMLASAMFFGRFLASYFWGVMADHKGRKPVIIASSIILGLSVCVFGFSVHFAMAILTRFLVGVANGVVGTAKAVVSEISDDSTQSLGVSIISTSWGFGFIIGPAISGAISDPIGQYNLNITNVVVHSFLTKFPYYLPCLVNTLLCLSAALTVFLLLPETKGSKKNRRRSEINQSELQAIASQHSQEGEEQGEELGSGFHGSKKGGVKEEDQRSLLGSCEGINELENEIEGDGENRETTNRRTVLHTYSVFISNIGADEKCRVSDSNDHHHHHHHHQRNCSSNEKEHCYVNLKETDVVGNGDISSAIELPGDGSSSPERGEGETATGRGREEVKLGWRGKVKRGIKTALVDLKLFLCSRGTSLSLFIYCIFSFAVIGFDEVYSLWAFTSPHHGGLGFTLYQIGISLSVAGTLMLPTNLFLYPLLERWLGLINCYYLSVCICIGLSVLMPNLHYLIPVGLTWLLWVMLCSMKFLFMVFVSIGFASTVLFINNSVTFDKLGAVNGLAVSMTAISRTVAPVFAGSVFAASLSPSTLAIGFPFNYNLIFVLFGGVFLSTAFLATCLPASLNKQKIIEDTTNDDDDDVDPKVKDEGADSEVKGEGASSLPSDSAEASMPERETAI